QLPIQRKPDLVALALLGGRRHGALLLPRVGRFLPPYDDAAPSHSRLQHVERQPRHLTPPPAEESRPPRRGVTPVPPRSHPRPAEGAPTPRRGVSNVPARSHQHFRRGVSNVPPRRR